MSKQQWEQMGQKAGWTKVADSQNIDNEFKSKHPVIHALVSRMPGYNSALDIVDNIKNNKVSPENAGINQDIINQAKQIIQSKTASSIPFDNTIIIKEALTLDARVIAAIILVIMGLWAAKAIMNQDAPKAQTGGFTQSEQMAQLLNSK